MKAFVLVILLTLFFGLLASTQGRGAYPEDLRAYVAPTGGRGTSPCITSMAAHLGRPPKISLRRYSTKVTLPSPTGSPSAKPGQSSAHQQSPFRFVALAPQGQPPQAAQPTNQVADAAKGQADAIRDVSQWSFEKGKFWGAKALERLGLNVLGHVQGAGVLRDVSIGSRRFSRAVASHNIDPNGFVMGAAEIGLKVGDTQTPRAIDYSGKRHALKIINNKDYGNHSHPGGLQAVGDYIAVAMQHSPDKSQPAGVYFIRADAFELAHVNTLLLPQRNDVPRHAEQGASAAGFVRLDDKRYLLAVTGRDYGKDGIWFFISSGDEIDQQTTWQHVDFWRPARLERGLCDIGSGEVRGDCYLGGEGISLIPDRRGNIYLILFQGSDNRGKREEHEFAQVFRLVLDDDKKIELIPLWHEKRSLGDVAIDDIAFRWSGSAFVNRNGALGFISTERKNTKGGVIHGLLRVSGTSMKPL